MSKEQKQHDDGRSDQIDWSKRWREILERWSKGEWPRVPAPDWK